jgi:hypothetical protein
MPVNPVWPGVVLALTARVVGADPAPTPVPTPVAPLRVHPAPQAVLLGGQPFPAVTPFLIQLAKPDRTVFVAAGAKEGDGSKARPWGDLQTALRALGPGDLLDVGPGDYTGPVRIDESCREGTRRRPVRVAFQVRAKLAPGAGAGTVGQAALTIARAYWHLSGVSVVLDQSASTGISVEGDAHDVTLDGARIAGGAGPSVLIGADTARVRIANAKISKSRLNEANPDAVGIVLAAGARDTLLANNHMSENPGGSIRVRAPPPAARRGREADRQRDARRRRDGDRVRPRTASDRDSTISDAPKWAGTRGIALGSVEHASTGNQVSDCAIGIQLGAAPPRAPGRRRGAPGRRRHDRRPSRCAGSPRRRRGR